MEIIVDGKAYRLVPVKEKETEEKKGPFERNHLGLFYCIDKFGGILKATDSGTKPDDLLYKSGNYCTENKLMEQRALHEKLNRLLWRYSMERGGSGFWIIVNKNGEFRAGLGTFHSIGSVSFPDYTTACNAIEEIVKPFLREHPGFEW